MINHNYSHIIWDWNGTLFDDVGWNNAVINRMLCTRGLPLLSTEEYRRLFCFPITSFYLRAGFTFEEEPFEATVEEYLTLYDADNCGNCGLHVGAKAALNSLRAKGIRQVVLSATQTSRLRAQMQRFDILNFFDEILGLPDNYATSKIEIGKDYMKRMDVRNILLIGDTLHDYEVAKELGADCILIANGHQSRAVLESCPAPVLASVVNAVNYVQ